MGGFRPSWIAAPDAWGGEFGFRCNRVVARLESIHYHDVTGIKRLARGNMRIQAFAMALAFALATAGIARANDVQFTITNTSGVQIATFELPLNPTPTFQFHWPLVQYFVCSGDCPGLRSSRQPDVFGGCTRAADLWGRGSIFPARNFTRARKAAQRFFCAPTCYSTSTMLHTK